MPYKIDLFAVLIFLGIVQAIFLSVFFFSKENRKIQFNLFYGFMLVSLAACLLEIFLMYTGYIVNCFYLVDFSEPFAFLIGPFFYFMVLSLIHGKINQRNYWHLAFAAIYTILIIPYFLQPEDVKYNSWVWAYKLDLPLRPYKDDPRIFWITNHHTVLTIISLVAYTVLSTVLVIRAFREKKESFLRPANPVFRKMRAVIEKIISATVLLLIIKYFNANDTGDHIFAAYAAFTIYTASFGVIAQSGFFKSASSLQHAAKYKNSTLTEEQQQTMRMKLEQVMKENKPFLQPDFSLPDLAAQLGTTIHILSQVINEGLGKSFFEMTAEYRIDEAKHLLKTSRHIKIEEIAQQVGYNSKSSFNTAFKKITGQTPSEFRTQ